MNSITVEITAGAALQSRGFRFRIRKVFIAKFLHTWHIAIPTGEKKHTPIKLMLF